MRLHDRVRDARDLPVGSALAMIAATGDATDPHAMQFRLSSLNRRRFAPDLPDLDWRDALIAKMTAEIEESAWLEAKRAEVADRAARAPTDPDGFVAWFVGLEHDGPGQGDPLFPWLAHEATLEQFRWFVEQEVAGEAGFEDLAAIAQLRLPARAKLEVARNYWDEMGRGNLRAMHGPLLERLVRHLGLAPRPETAVTETLALANTMAGLACHRRYAYHIVGALGAIEQTAPGRAQHVAQGLARVGVPSTARLYFTLHAQIDVRHAAQWNAEVLWPLVAERPEVAHAIAEGALMRLECGRACFERYRRELWGASGGGTTDPVGIGSMSGGR